VTGGYPNEAVFWGSDLAMSTREKRLDINSVVRKARMAEHCDIVPFRMIGDTRIECRYASSQRKSTRFEPTCSNRRGAQPGSPAGFDWPGRIANGAQISTIPSITLLRNRDGLLG
jgi:hypothetical protein